MIIEKKDVFVPSWIPFLKEDLVGHIDKALLWAGDKGVIFNLRETERTTAQIQTRRGDILSTMGFTWSDRLDEGGFCVFAGVASDHGLKRIISAEQRSVFLETGAVRICPHISYDLYSPKVFEIALPIEFINAKGEAELLIELRKFGHTRQLTISDGNSVTSYRDKFRITPDLFIEQVLWQSGLSYEMINRLDEKGIERLIRAISRGELALQSMFFRQRLDLVTAALALT